MFDIVKEAMVCNKRRTKIKGGVKMPEFDFSGNFVNEENCEEGDIMQIIAHPMPQEKESNEMAVIDGVVKKKKYMVLNMDVEYSDKKKTYTPDAQTGRRFNASWGRDYSKWIGKKFSVKKEKYKAFGVEKIRIAGYPLE